MHPLTIQRLLRMSALVVLLMSLPMPCFGAGGFLGGAPTALCLIILGYAIANNPLPASLIVIAIEPIGFVIVQLLLALPQGAVIRWLVRGVSIILLAPALLIVWHFSRPWAKEALKPGFYLYALSHLLLFVSCWVRVRTTSSCEQGFGDGRVFES